MPVVFNKAALPPEDLILAAAASMEPRLRDAFLAAVSTVKSQVQLNKLSDAIQKGDINGAMAMLAIDEKFAAALQGAGLAANVQSVRDALQAAYAAGAKAAMQQLPAKVSTSLSFDLMNPEAVNFLRSYNFELIQQITSQTREAIRQIITRAFQTGGHPYEQAREIRDVIGLTARMEQAVANYRQALETGGNALKDALSRSLRDGRFDSTLMRALQNNTPLDKAYIDKLVARYRERYLKYRAEMVARTESIRASNRGQRELWRQARQQGLLPHTAKRVWIAFGDDSSVPNGPCPVCADLHDQTAGMDEEFAPGIFEPPDPHPNCRCTLAISTASIRAAA
jgi:hypothetical protein